MSQITPIDPRTGTPRTPIDCTPVNSIPDLVSKSRSAQAKWAQMPLSEKRPLFEAFAKDLADHASELAELVSAEMGKLPKQALAEANTYSKKVARDLDLMEKALEPETLKFDGGSTQVNFIPHGVAVAITPWNFPIGMPLNLIIPSLYAGNTVLFKPSEITTATGLKLAELLNRHLPENVLIPVVGAEEQGNALVTADIDFIAFVGSREVGKKILAKASDRVCRVLLEMGGKDAMVVGKDADVDKAARFAVRGAVSNSGQVCCSVERIYIEKELEPTFISKIMEELKNVAVGEEKEGAVCYGPMSNEHQMNIVLDHMADAKAKGATIHQGGERLDKDNGFYISPALVSDVTDEMKLISEETFGPVITIQAVNSVDEGIEKANNTRYGLTASIWMGNENEARQKAIGLQAGVVGINRPFSGSPHTPWAGAKESGYGHTNGISGMRHFVQPRSLTMNAQAGEANS